MSSIGKALAAAASGVCLFLSVPTWAALQTVSGLPDPAVDGISADGQPRNVSYSLANGFPLWYQDDAGPNGLKLGLCLDQRVEFTPGVVSTPCLTAEPFPGAPISFPANFGSEAFWWMAATFGTFNSSLTVDGAPTQVLGGDALIVLALEAAFANEIAVDGDQVAFGRIRLRLNVPVAGTYEITHPYGRVEYTVTTLTAGREINQTQDVGNLPPHVPVGTVPPPAPPAGAPPRGDFTLALENGLAPTPPVGFDPAINAEIVSREATGIGPFLRPAANGVALAPLVATNGAMFIADPGSDLVPLEVTVTGSPFNTNEFRIKLLDPPPGFHLNAADQSQEVVFDRFQVMGKIFDDGPNVPPVAAPDAVATAVGAPVTIDVLANDADAIAASNRHGIDPQAIGLPSNDPADLPGTILLTRPLTTANGGTVRRSTSFVTGETRFVYTPRAGFSGTDTFEYVVQDTGGLVSNRAAVTVLVEDLRVDAAEFRARTGKWRIGGTSSMRDGNTVTLHASPRATLTGAEVVPAVASGAHGAVTFEVRPGAIAYRLALDVAPSSTVTAAHLHLGAPGENGPAVFFLFDGVVEGPLTGSKSGTLTPQRMLFVPGPTAVTFEDVLAAVLAGNAYVDVHTASSAGGELRGQIARPRIGSAPVDAATGRWSFTARSSVTPGGPPASVNAVSSRGVRAVAAPLQIR